MAFKSESQKAERNCISKEIAVKKQRKENVSEMILAMKLLGVDIEESEKEFKKTEADYLDGLALLPNICHASTPVGTSEADNKVERKVGDIPQFDFTPRDHIILGHQLKIIDFERAAKISGARFVILQGWGARLERVLCQFMLDVQTKKHGYIETMPPYVVKEKSLWNTGQFPKFKEDVFHIKKQRLVPYSYSRSTYHQLLCRRDLGSQRFTFSFCSSNSLFSL